MISKELKNSIGIHHLVLTVADVQATERFYTRIFGEPNYANQAVAIYSIGKTMLIFTQKDERNAGKMFDPNVIGLEHFAFSLKNLEELKQVENVLTENKIKNSGIHIDKDSGKEKIWLNDPSNIRVEFYL